MVRGADPAGAARNDPRVTYFADNVLTSQETRSEAPRRLIALREVATVSLHERPTVGEYTFTNQPGKPRRSVCLAIIKQSDAQLLHLRTELDKLQAQFRKDYPQLQFALSQDQTELLDVSISNLISNLLTGALLTFGMIFFFMRDRRLPVLIGLVIPISIAVTFLGFYGLGLTINIVSLAGLVLGRGYFIAVLYSDRPVRISTATSDCAPDYPAGTGGGYLLALSGGREPEYIIGYRHGCPDWLAGQ